MAGYIKKALRLVLGTFIGLIVGLIIALLGFIIILYLLPDSQGGVFAGVAIGLVMPRLVIMVMVTCAIISLLYTKHRVEKRINEAERQEIKRYDNLISAFLIVVIVITGYIFFVRSGILYLMSKPPKRIEPDSCSRIEDSSRRDLCFYSLAEQSLPKMTVEQAINICREIEGVSRRDNCFYLLALRDNDPARCEELTDSYSRGNCKARIAKEVSDCDNPEIRNKTLCYESVARVKKDFSICDSSCAVNKFIKESCYAGIYSAIAVENKDASVCNNIIPGDKKDACKADVAIACNNRSACKDITMILHRSRCTRETSRR